MSRALIGHTGFVGSTLTRAREYTAVYNSKNIEEIAGRVFDTVVCAGASAAKWRANQDPESDAAEIRRLMMNLDRVKARRCVLISTIDVYRNPVNVNESDVPADDELHPYGKHRLMLEDYVRTRFVESVVVRLPGLFGLGLRKNLIFDFLNKNQTEQIKPNGRLQWYPMNRFPNDLETILDSGVKLINIAVEPVRTEEIRTRFFPDIAIDDTASTGPQYDMHTNLASLLGGNGKYHLNSEQMLSELASFIDSQRVSL
jgi:hypothetical protein